MKPSSFSNPQRYGKVRAAKESRRRILIKIEFQTRQQAARL
ncbi:hypothetical protein [Methylovulum psychrotolerans]|nr:hypothetical protein [Methylovulum psychrotolerans]